MTDYTGSGGYYENLGDKKATSRTESLARWQAKQEKKPMTDLHTATDAELQTEFNRRERIRKDLEAQRRQEEASRNLECIDMFLKLVHSHSRTSCNDANPHNLGRCTRCDLLDIKSSNYWPTTMAVSLSIFEVPDEATPIHR